MIGNKRKQGNILIGIGLLLIAVALFLTGRNLYNDYKAGQHSDDLVSLIRSEVLDKLNLNSYDPNSPWDDLPDYVRHPDMELPVGEIDGLECVGILQIHSMDREFPVMADLSDYLLAYGPCKYHGTPYKDNFVIGAHNFLAHFGAMINELEEGDKVTFIDMAGNVFDYTVSYMEVLQPYDYYEMVDSEWDLSLFTCTWDLGSRYTFRCMRDNKQVNYVDLG